MALCCALTAGWSAQASAEDCASLSVSFKNALKQQDIAAAEVIENKIVDGVSCGLAEKVELQRLRAAAEVKMASALEKDPARQDERERLLVDADKPSVSWIASYALGEFYLKQRKFVEATQAYERAIEIVNNETFTPKKPDADNIQDLFKRTSEAKMLAANEENNKKAAYVTAPRTRDGKVGGALSASVRDVKPVAVPLPINFEYNEARFTAIGEKAAAELAQALIEQRPREIKLIGHTDDRGGDDYNMALSKARVEAVVRYLSRALKEKGVAMEVRAEYYGKRRPLRLEDTTGFTQEDIWALNRRVEFVRVDQ